MNGQTTNNSQIASRRKALHIFYSTQNPTYICIFPINMFLVFVWFRLFMLDRNIIINRANN